jgi:glycerol-1-phosphate dehydrogenase [NAD(P)+]
VEWRIAKIAVGEYYCGRVADAVAAALDACVKNAEGLLRRDTEAVRAVVEGLILSGLAMTAAGLSRPASGEEHYISHLWDMRGLSFGTKVELHGLQCAVGTRIAVGVYEKLRAFPPDREKALRAAAAFDKEAWERELRAFLGHAAEPMIALEEKEGKYDREKHRARLDTVLAHWEEIRKEICSLPTQAEIDRILDAIGAPKTPEEMGIDPQTVPVALRRAGDIRDKYVLSRLLWDLGISPAAEE